MEAECGVGVTIRIVFACHQFIIRRSESGNGKAKNDFAQRPLMCIIKYQFLFFFSCLRHCMLIPEKFSESRHDNDPESLNRMQKNRINCDTSSGRLSVHFKERNGAKIRRHKRHKDEMARRFSHILSAIAPATLFEVNLTARYQVRQNSFISSESTLHNFNPSYQVPIFKPKLLSAVVRCELIKPCGRNSQAKSIDKSNYFSSSLHLRKVQVLFTLFTRVDSGF